MAKAVSDAVLDAALAKIATGNKMVVCSSQPTTYAEANSTYKLAEVAMTTGLGSGDYTAADDTSGRKVTMTAKNTIAITATGTATHIAIIDTATSALLYVTTCNSQSLTSGNTVNIPSWKVNIADPT